jgi:hypothetical protein
LGSGARRLRSPLFLSQCHWIRKSTIRVGNLAVAPKTRFASRRGSLPHERASLPTESGIKPEVQALGTSVTAANWQYTRDIEGSVLIVGRTDVTGVAWRFDAPARDRGFQLRKFGPDGTSMGSLSHDTAGRVTAEAGRSYTYDDFHSLVRAGASSGTSAQGFQYDGLGRLIAVRRGTTGWPVEEEVAYDGEQMVAA